MAGYKSLGVLLAVAALLAAAASAVEDEHMYHWKCFKSCTGNCHDEDAAFDDDVVAKDGHHPAGGSNASAVVSGGKCKDRCLNECFEDLPAQCYHQCVVTNCLCFPPCMCTPQPSRSIYTLFISGILITYYLSMLLYFCM